MCVCVNASVCVCVYECECVCVMCMSKLHFSTCWHYLFLSFPVLFPASICCKNKIIDFWFPGYLDTPSVRVN